MKIAVIGPFYPFRGGIAQFTSQMAQELSSSHELLCVNFSKLYPSLLFPGKTQYDKSKEFLHIINQRLLTPYNLFTFSKTAEAVISFAPDLVIFNYWIPFTAIAYQQVAKKIKQKTSAVIITVVHNLEAHEKWLLAENLTRCALRSSDYLVTLSQSVCRTAEKLFPAKKIIAAFHPNYLTYRKDAFDNEAARKALNITAEKVVLFFGYIKPYKGLDLLLKAFSILLEKKPQCHLLIVGEVYGSAKPYYKMIDQLNIDKKVTFLQHFVSNEDVEKYFMAADMVVLPYRQATQSGVAQIAFSMGLGVVVTPVGGLPEIVQNEKTGIVAASLKPDDIAEALVKYLELDSKKIKDYTRQESKRYSWQSFSELVLKQALEQ